MLLSGVGQARSLSRSLIGPARAFGPSCARRTLTLPAHGFHRVSHKAQRVVSLHSVGWKRLLLHWDPLKRFICAARIFHISLSILARGGVRRSHSPKSFEAQRDDVADHFLDSGTVLSDTTNGCRRMGAILPAIEMHVKDAVSALRNGQVIALPTDTVYGLAADACSALAVQKLYDMKGRSATSPLAVCVGHLAELEKYSVTSHLPKGLMEDLLPGPVTLVLQRGEHSFLEKSLNPGLTSIGVRIPDCSFICQVAKSFGGALALTSANSSGQSSTVCVQEFEQLWEQCAYVFDAGELSAGRAGSTIVDLTNPGRFKIIRRGSAFEETTTILKRYGFVQTSAT
eukprot:c26668_g1_i1 orf=75-1100(+)